jgi:[ribosomal protein S18]-alanine N-acetyltransferase
MVYQFRALTPSDQDILWELLYYAIHVPNGQKPPSRAILESPNIARYAADSGRQGDTGQLAIESGIPVGSAWLRLMHGYGYVEEDIPELSIAVLPSHPGRGMGTTLLNEIIKFAEPIYRGVSLSVALENQAAHLYEKFGFKVVGIDGDSKIMLLRFKNDKTKIT